MIDAIKLKDDYTTIEPINKGWSSDSKYYLVKQTGEKHLLRVAPRAEYQQKKSEFAMMQEVIKSGISMPRPLAIWTDEVGVYSLFTWMEGEDAEDTIATLSIEKQYQLGYQAGTMLANIHQVPAPLHIESWYVRFNRKIDTKIEKYLACGMVIDGGVSMIAYLQEHRHLLVDRPQTFQHGDFHIGNMVVNHDNISIIDFNRCDFGDPWEEFNRIVWCASISPVFASARIHGYFQGDPPALFFRLLALYIASNTLSSVYWSIPFGQSQVDVMTAQANEVLAWFDGMKQAVPSWYIPFNLQR